jgi:hypothetical protein
VLQDNISQILRAFIFIPSLFFTFCHLRFATVFFNEDGRIKGNRLRKLNYRFGQDTLKVLSLSLSICKVMMAFLFRPNFEEDRQFFSKKNHIVSFHLHSFGPE